MIQRIKDELLMILEIILLPLIVLGGISTILILLFIGV